MLGGFIERKRHDNCGLGAIGIWNSPHFLTLDDGVLDPGYG
jgi:hypothetical protein